jgi:hypothetical protein
VFDIFGDTYKKLLHAQNVVSELSGVEAELLSDQSTTLSRIMIDNATVDYALSFLSSGADQDRWKPVLPTRVDVYASALHDLIQAIVLFDEVIVGPGGPTVWYGRDDLQATQALLTDGSELLSSKLVFALLNLSRHAAIDSLGGDSDTFRALQATTTATLSRASVLSFLDSMTPLHSHHSPHKLAQVDPLDDAVWGILGPSRIAMDAIDEDNRGRKFGNNEYFGYLAKRGSVTFPQENYEEFFAAALIHRSFFYLYASELLGSTYSADAYRTPIVKSLLSTHASGRDRFAQIVMSAVGNDEARRDEIVNNAFGFDAFSVSTPIVALAVLHKSSRVEDIMPVALEMRSQRSVQDFRAYCHTVDTAIRAGDRSAVEDALRDLSALGVQMAKDIEGQDATDSAMTSIKELASYGSRIVKALWPLLAEPAQKLYKKVRYRRLAFLDDLKSTPRIVPNIERELKRLTQR